MKQIENMKKKVDQAVSAANAMADTLSSTLPGRRGSANAEKDAPREVIHGLSGWLITILTLFRRRPSPILEYPSRLDSKRNQVMEKKGVQVWSLGIREVCSEA